MQETIEEEMRGTSFDSPTGDLPSSNFADAVPPTDRTVVCCQASDDDVDRTLTPRRDSASTLAYPLSSSSSPAARRTWSVACLRPRTDLTTADERRLTAGRCVTRSMPSVDHPCVCDVAPVPPRTSKVATDCEPSPVASDAAGSPHHHPSLGVVRTSSQQRVSRSDPDMLKLPPPITSNGGAEKRKASCRRTWSLDRTTHRPQRRPTLGRGDAVSLQPVNLIFPTASRSTAAANSSVQL